MKKFNIFFAEYMSHCTTFTFQVSISTKVSFKILLGKDMFTLIFVDLENETSISILAFEMMNYKNNIFAFISARYTIKFTEQK